jgi:hypothetical protein
VIGTGAPGPCRRLCGVVRADFRPLLDLWAFLCDRLFSRLDASFTAAVDLLGLQLQRLWIVKNVSRGRMETVDEFLKEQSRRSRFAPVVLRTVVCPQLRPSRPPAPADFFRVVSNLTTMAHINALLPLYPSCCKLQASARRPGDWTGLRLDALVFSALC